MGRNHEYQLASTTSAEETRKPQPRRKRTVPKALLVVSLFVLSIVIFSASISYPHIYNSIIPRDTNLSVTVSSLSLSAEPEETETVFEKNLKASLSETEKDKIDELRIAVMNNVTHSYMTTDSYLIRWLRAREWDVEEATEMLLKHLEWREEYDMDNALQENFTMFRNEYLFYMDGFDKNEGPVACMNVGDWNLKKITLAGIQHEYLRYVFSHFEKGIRHIVEAQAKGKTVSQGILLINVANFSMKLHGCLSCIPNLTSVLFGLDDNYPGWLHHIIFINTPEMADIVLDIITAYLTGENKEAFKVYGFNKQEWQAKILSLIPADQIRPEFGGTKVDD